MSEQDPISDLICRIKNALRANKPTLTAKSSKVKVAIVKVLKDEGYILDFEVIPAPVGSDLRIDLKYYEEAPVISMIKRVSKPGLRVYRSCKDLWLHRVSNGLGVALISTSMGVMTDKAARKLGQGGEVLCELA